MRDIGILREALPYLRRHRSKTIVLKIGGEIAAQPEALASLAQDLSLLSHVNIRMVVVHGGGPQATQMSLRLGLEPRMVQGRRVTDGDTLDVAKMIFAGQINVEILSALQAQGVRAVGLSGVDGNLIQARRRPPTEVRDVKTGEVEMVDFGHVGDVVDVDVHLVRLLVENGYVPVISSLADDVDGNILNINADTVASRIAAELKAHKLISLTSVRGLLRDPADPQSLVLRSSAAEIERMIQSGAISGGMVPKVTSLLDAVRGGVEAAIILSGVERDALLLELFTDQGVGTLIEAESPA